jgi:hypothetical protein
VPAKFHLRRPLLERREVEGNFHRENKGSTLNQQSSEACNFLTDLPVPEKIDFPRSPSLRFRLCTVEFFPAYSDSDRGRNVSSVR